jgi:hypothetical protein
MFVVLASIRRCRTRFMQSSFNDRGVMTSFVSTRQSIETVTTRQSTVTWLSCQEFKSPGSQVQKSWQSCLAQLGKHISICGVLTSCLCKVRQRDETHTPLSGEVKCGCDKSLLVRNISKQTSMQFQPYQIYQSKRHSLSKFNPPRRPQKQLTRK